MPMRKGMGSSNLKFARVTATFTNLKGVALGLGVGEMVLDSITRGLCGYTHCRYLSSKVE